MAGIKDIFGRATIRGIADYLLFGIGPDKDERSYEERLEELYMRFEKTVELYDKDPCSELLDLINEITSETASVYTEIGLQAGLLLMKDIIQNTAGKQQESTRSGEGSTVANRANESLLEGMYKGRVEKSLQEVLYRDEKYRKADQEAERIIREIEQIGLDQKESEIIGRALSASNSRCEEYGRVVYRQGFMDAVSLLGNK